MDIKAELKQGHQGSP